MLATGLQVFFTFILGALLVKTHSLLSLLSQWSRSITTVADRCVFVSPLLSAATLLSVTFYNTITYYLSSGPMKRRMLGKCTGYLSWIFFFFFCLSVSLPHFGIQYFILFFVSWRVHLQELLPPLENSLFSPGLITSATAWLAVGKRVNKRHLKNEMERESERERENKRGKE